MKLDYRRTFVIGLGFFGISVMWSVYNSFVPIFLRDYDLPWWLVGFVMTLDNILGITLLPYIGQLSDATRSRWGRRKPFMLLGAPIAALFFVAVPLLHLALPRTGGALFALTAVLFVMNVAMALFRTPTVALMPDVTPPPLRSKANGVINLMGGLGTTIAFLGGGLLFRQGQALPFVLAALLLLAAVAIVVLRVEEPPAPETGETSRARQRLGSALRETLANVAELGRGADRSALFMCLAIFCWFMGYNVVETFWTSYGREVLYAPQIAAGLLTGEQAAGNAASMLTYMSAAFLVVALPAGLIGTRYGRKPTILAGLAVLILFWLGMLLGLGGVYVPLVLVLSGVSWALININSLPIMVDLAPGGKIGAYTGLYYFFSMLAASTSPTIAGWLMDLAGMRVMLIFVPVFMALAGLCMLGVRRSEPRDTADVETALRMVAEADF